MCDYAFRFDYTSFDSIIQVFCSITINESVIETHSIKEYVIEMYIRLSQQHSDVSLQDTNLKIRKLFLLQFQIVCSFVSFQCAFILIFTLL